MHDALRARRARRHHLRRSTPARCSASPASRATGRPSWSRPSSACVPAAAATCRAGRRGHHRLGARGERRESGIGYIPEDRQRHGLLLDAPLWENRILGHQTRPPSVQGCWINRARRARRLRAHRRRRTTSARRASTPPRGRCPGGNQQKFIVGREMSGDPVLLVASAPDPRRRRRGPGRDLGPDPGGPPRSGSPCCSISADLDELIGLSDTIQVILRGRLVGEFDPRTVTPQQLGSAMTGAGRGRGEPRAPRRRWRWPRRSSPSSSRR